ncbi:hypothetical protein D8674_013756 [Pyrus ussuriensis x Pyrus communis]|uniref:Uncharacterized protein n=1 Tax=Pyrus ussuriensis x Pyrus communis TaxID=2448454 RepID=A0A5N5GRV3_9ROSA|nr:hypothetical protein D8674_013756 [Pyrus ussuriensis x Pyrus communis]
MSSSSHKSDDGVPPLYRQGGTLSKVGYFKGFHYKMSSDDSFKDFPESYKHAIPSGVNVKCVKQGSSHSEFSLTPKTSPNIKKVHVAFGILAKKCGLPSRKEIKQIKAEALALPIAVVEPAMPAEKKSKASFAARESPPTVHRLVIDLTFSKGKKDKAARYDPMTSAILKVASMIVNRIAQRIGSVVPPVLKYVPRHTFRAKSGSHSEKLTIMKSDKVDYAVKVALRPILLAAETSSPTEKEITACVGSCEKSTKPIFREAVEICVLLKPDLLEDIDACAKLVDSVRKKMTILVAESMLLDQKDTNAAKEMTKTITAEAYSSAEKIKRLENELVVLKGPNIFAPLLCSLRLAEKEIGYYIPYIQDLKRAVSDLRFAAYKEVDELQHVHVGLLEENEQLKGEKARLEVMLVQSQANFYKLGYVYHLFGRSSDFEFDGKDFETFFISLEDLLAFTFNASIGEVVGEVGAQVGAAAGVPLFFDLFVVHGGKGITTFTAYSTDLNHLVGCFDLPIALGIPRRGRVLLDAIFLEKLCKIFTYKLQAIVCDDGLRDAKSANDVPPYEALYVYLSHGCHGLYFQPFGEVVSCHDH